MRNNTKWAIVLTVLTAMILTGCMRPYDTPEFITITPSQTAFLIPLVGDTTSQAGFESEELLEQAKVATKEIQIPHRWVQTGRYDHQGEWRASATLVIVERKPATREWTADKDSGSSLSNQAIYAESKESIGFSVGMNCSAQIDEENATKFLYRYNNKSLEEIMDTELRAMVESEFNKECSKYLIGEIIENKQKIMDVVVNNVSSFFAERGITITVLGMKDGIQYEDQAIQDAINEKFSSEQKLVTQQNENAVAIAEVDAQNQMVISQAEAQAEANRILSESLTPELLEQRAYDKWDGKLPVVMMGESDAFIDVSPFIQPELQE